MTQIPAVLLPYVQALLRERPLPAPSLSDARWRELLSALTEQWVVPLVFQRVAGSPSYVRPPTWVYEQLRGAYHESRLRALRAEAQLREMLGVFHDADCRVLVLKGIALGYAVYGDPAVRISRDIDVLVRPEDVESAEEILERLGYRCAEKRHLPLVEEFHFQETFLHPRGPAYYPVELHWDINFHARVLRDGSGNDLFERAVTVQAGDLHLEALHPVDALICGAVHLTRSHGDDRRLLWLCDIAGLAGLLDGPEQWRELQTRSVRFKARMAVEDALTAAWAALGMVRPQECGNFTRWPKPTAEETASYSPRSAGRAWLTEIRRVLMRGGPGSCGVLVGFCLQTLFPRPTVMYLTARCRTRGELPLRYAQRWMKWLGKLFRSLSE